MVLVKATEDSEKGVVPTAETKEMMEAMGRFNDELVKAGIMKDGDCDGLTPSSQGKRIAFDGPDRTVMGLPPPPRAGHRFLAVGSQGHERGGRLGEALP
nr:hypothetical protein [Nitrosomonas sp. PY1]